MPSSICIVGGVMLDYVTHLHDASLFDFSKDTEQWVSNEIEWHAAGTGTNMATAAITCGFEEVSLISKVGLDRSGQPDMPAQSILNKLKQKGVHALLSGDSNVPTGTDIIIYFGENERVIIADNRSEVSFNEDDITREMLETAGNSEILFVSGYTLLSQRPATAVARLMKEAQKQQRLVVLDVVPHKIYKRVTHAEFREYTQSVNVLISEVNTLRRLFPAVAQYDDLALDKLADYLLGFYDALILRPSWGLQLTYSKDGLVEKQTVQYPTSDVKQLRGFFETVSMTTLKKHYARLRNN